MNETKETFREVNESYTIKEAIDEAKRCLNCKNPSCKKGCPIENDIPCPPFADVYALTKNNAKDIVCFMPKEKASK